MFFTCNNLNKIDIFDKIVFTRNYTKIQESITNNIKKDVISSYFEIDNKELLKTSSGIFLTRITSDPDNICHLLSEPGKNKLPIPTKITVINISGAPVKLSPPIILEIDATITVPI